VLQKSEDSVTVGDPVTFGQPKLRAVGEPDKRTEAEIARQIEVRTGKKYRILALVYMVQFQLRK